MFKPLIAISCLLVAVSIQAYPQKVRTVTGEYTYVVPETESFAEAKEKALFRARIQALADTFGTTLDMSSSTSISSSNGAKTISLSDSSVKGEWLETIGEPEISRLIDDNGVMAIRVRVKGKARQIVASSLDFEAVALKNGTDKRFAADDFKDGDDLYLSFRSSENGFLTVYLYDGIETVYRLLPYQAQNGGAFPIVGGRDYIFFSPEVSDGVSQKKDIDNYYLNCQSDFEINRLYVIFSENHYSKALDRKGSDNLPQELALNDFQKWIHRLRSLDTRLCLKTIDLTIRNN